MKDKKKTLKILGLVAVILAIILTVMYRLVRTKTIVLNSLVINRDTEVVGVDVSEFQETIDMSVLKQQGIQFVIIRATEGSSYQDVCFAENWKNARDSGLLRGAYHFFSFDSSGASQALNFINTVRELRGDMVPFVDVEYYGDKRSNPPEKEDVISELKVYLDALEDYYGVKPVIYCSAEISKQYIDGNFDEYQKWFRNVYEPFSAMFNRDWIIWQYCDTAVLEGYYGGEKYIDLDVLNSRYTLEDIIINN